MNNVKRFLPIGGIVAFSLCSVTSIYHLLVGQARNPSPVLWLPSVLIELVTAWAVTQVVEQGRRVTRSNISKQDRRFYAGVLAAFISVALPLLATSVWANAVEFQSVALGALFPIGSIGCAIGAALPEVTERYRQTREAERDAKVSKRHAKARQAEAKARQRQAKDAQRQRQTLAKLGKSAPVFELYCASPMLTQAKAAEELGISRQAVGYHLSKLEEGGVIRRNGEGVEVLWWG
jgi:DNA-binding transcriptional ArsR family regulator